MQGLTQPTLLLKRFCESGTKNTLPVTNTDASNPQLADLTNGFPIITQGDPTDGKLPPERADFNALGYLTTSYDYFYQAGGTFTFNSTIASAIGGYPLGSRLWYTNASGRSMILRSTKDDNTDDFTQDESYIGTSWVIESMMGVDNSSISLLDYKFSDKVINNMSWIQSNGSWYSGSTYTNVMSHLKEDIAFQATSTPSVVVESNSDFTSGTYVRDSGEDKTIDGITYYAWSDTDTFYVIVDIDAMSGSDALSALQGQAIYRYDSDESDMFLTIHKVAKSSSDIIKGITINYLIGSDGHRIINTDDDTDFTNLYVSTGVAWYYIVDTTNNRFKLPLTKWNFVGSRGNLVGKYVEETLPNIKGEHDGLQWPTIFTGCYEDGGVSATNAPNAQPSGRKVIFNAGKSSNVYKDGANVQQTATEMYLYFYIGGFNQTAIEQTAGINSNTINQKADVDLGNITLTAIERLAGWNMPDYDSGISMGWTNFTVTSNGWLFCYSDVNGSVNNVLVNGVIVYTCGNNIYVVSNGSMIPVSKGDVVTVSGSVYSSSGIYFYPCKGV